MTPSANKINRTGKSSLLQQIVLLFLVGFFIGAAFYYLFQNSFAEMLGTFQKQLTSWQENKAPLSVKMVHAVWNHGRFYLLFWLLSVTRIRSLYQSAFVLYTGFQNGFLILFFVFARGPAGILLYLTSLLPHALLFVPLYLTSFSFAARKGNHTERRWGAYLLFALTFFAACFLEAKCNLILMESVVHKL